EGPARISLSWTGGAAAFRTAVIASARFTTGSCRSIPATTAIATVSTSTHNAIAHERTMISPFQECGWRRGNDGSSGDARERGGDHARGIGRRSGVTVQERGGSVKRPRATPT